jgi:uncharacterized protein (TIGR04255 family)
MDHFMHVDDDFIVQDIVDNLWSLHDHQMKAFAASVTEPAMEEWSNE